MNSNSSVIHQHAARKKWVRVLAALVERPNLNRFQAERDPAIHDHCLPSTVSEMQRKGIRITRRLVDLPGYGGATALVAEYSLDDDQRQRARELLAQQ